MSEPGQTPESAIQSAYLAEYGRLYDMLLASLIAGDPSAEAAGRFKIGHRYAVLARDLALACLTASEAPDA